ncbi:alpha/beta fold hydrolase [Reichenbachiella carrageenanivorans]|uniref:Alpha/beta fold hydrolase n=1 Tax=Reichenbachiella carrageenanivorans TaxID=2979869 RepID=A0ABY6CVN2_9BACT|nr:alpha/beta fold hydrolase [Reichenbachiella carrageenanivorans]UXX77967.1 alpha/beta fold hydrolase [Reichenbachiella carrageenanivorans]
MPLIVYSSYQSSWDFVKNGHLQTIIPSLFRKIKGVNYTRERINTTDGDFLDLDWIKSGYERLVIISHGLEGNSDRHYIKSCARHFNQYGYDVLAWNYRSCSGEMNRNLRLYHHGDTEDLEQVITHAIDTRKYKKIVLVGFSMGGSTTLKYLGENGPNVPKHIVAAATFSVPCNLWDSAHQLTFRENWFFKQRFLKKMIKKVKLKHEQYPDAIDLTDIDKIVSFGQFDERYTAPLHGFRNSRHFYRTVTSDLHYTSIRIPALIVNAKNDPMLGEKCYPYTTCKHHDFLYLETPRVGGHVGFFSLGDKKSWMDERALEFVEKYAKL